MRTRRASILAAAALTVAIIAPATPVAAQSSGTVGATVTVAGDTGACLTVSTVAVDFGTLQFSTAGNLQNGFGTPGYAISNCGSSNVNVNVRGTDAIGDEGATWSLVTAPFVSDCAQLDRYRVDVAFTGGAAVDLDTVDQPLTMLSPGGSAEAVDHLLEMPCQGSAGAGQQMSFDIVYTATAA